MNFMSTWSYSEYIYIIWSKCVRESFFYHSQMLTEMLEDKQIAKLGGSWYVQNVSTFSNTFAVVSPLICVFWDELTLFSIELLWCLFLCRNPTFSKNLGKYCKNPISPEVPRSEKMRRRGVGRPPHNQRARPRPGHAHLLCDRLGHRLDPSFYLHIPSDLKGAGLGRFSQIDFHCTATIRNRDSEPETPFWHPVRMGIWRRSSSPSSLTSLHQPSMTPPSICE
jgi:hypothetical protein